MLSLISSLPTYLCLFQKPNHIHKNRAALLQPHSDTLGMTGEAKQPIMAALWQPPGAAGRLRSLQRKQSSLDVEPATRRLGVEQLRGRRM